MKVDLALVVEPNHSLHELVVLPRSKAEESHFRPIKLAGKVDIFIEFDLV